MREPTQEEIEVVEAWQRNKQIQEVSRELEEKYDELHTDSLSCYYKKHELLPGCGISEKGLLGLALDYLRQLRRTIELNSELQSRCWKTR